MAYLPTDHSRPSCHFSKILAHVSFVASSSLRSNIDSEDELSAALFPQTSGVSGPNDSWLSELTDDPGMTRGTKLSVLQIILFPF